ncbi:hypothetical protein MTR_8g464830 [Medicago truncatula]|uniref:Uncharacterized protein n=1 Tax=Medicago truncatula TaxID=3880 RepID=A0A072TRX8_MEDTR|nr:hypothetical protein MTR_8g464830 [Medicago truncatula]
MSRSPSSTGKCRNCKLERRDPSSKPGPHSCMCDTLACFNIKCRGNWKPFRSKKSHK